jgi:hypothetical protein
MKGRYKFTLFKNGKEVGETDWIHNRVMRGVGNGTGIIMRQLAGDLVYPIAITSAEIGTGSTPPLITDTNLQTPVLTAIPVRTKLFTATTATFSFFISDADLANGTYREFALRAGTQLFARSLISPIYTKATGMDAIVTYELDMG